MIFNFEKVAGRIEGWLTKAEGLFLYQIAKSANKEAIIIEIGSWKGRSTVCLASGSRDGDNVKIVAIDPHTGSKEHQKMFGKVDTYAEFIANLEQFNLTSYVSIIKDTSRNASSVIRNNIDFVFIDGAHEVGSVFEDFNLWFSKIKIGGMVAFHDSWHNPGPHLASAVILLTSSQAAKPLLVDTITVFKKVRKNTIFDRLYNIFFVLSRLILGVKGFLRIKYKGTLIK